MANGNIEYIADSLLIDSLLPLNKQAGAADTFLSSAASSIMDFAKEHIKTDNGVSGIMSSLAGMMIPAVLFKIHPALGILATVAHTLGFDVVPIIKSVLSLVKTKLESGSQLTMDEVNEAGKSAVSSLAGPITSNNMLSHLYQLEKTGILKLAGPWDSRYSRYNSSSSSSPTIPFFGGKGTLLQRVFGDLLKSQAKGKARWLLGGFVVWILKSLLLGAGLIAAGEGIYRLISPNHKGPHNEKTNQDNQHDSSDDYQHDSQLHNHQEVSPKHDLKPSGSGTEIHKNDHTTSVWTVPLMSGSIEKTLLAWATDVYPELKGKESVIISSQSFNKTVNDMKADLNESTSKFLVVPSKFKSRKQVVDQFAAEAAKG